MALPTYGTMAVDWENRVDFDRLRRERLARAKELLAKSEMGALLCFDMNNVRYLTATHIGTWAQDKANRFTLLPQNDEPILWDFGSAAKHHQLHCPWLGERSRAGISMLRGAMTPEMGRAEDVAKKIRIERQNDIRLFELVLRISVAAKRSLRSSARRVLIHRLPLHQLRRGILRLHLLPLRRERRRSDCLAQEINPRATRALLRRRREPERTVAHARASAQLPAVPGRAECPPLL